jgi:hypothetical protein
MGRSEELFQVLEKRGVYLRELKDSIEEGRRTALPVRQLF